MSYLRYLCFFAYGGVILLCFSLSCCQFLWIRLFLIGPLVFSSVYLCYGYRFFLFLQLFYWVLELFRQPNKYMIAHFPSLVHAL
jgi:hypothetical protein